MHLIRQQRHQTVARHGSGSELCRLQADMLVLAGAYPNHASLTISNNVLNGSSFTPMLVCLCGRLNSYCM